MEPEDPLVLYLFEPAPPVDVIAPDIVELATEIEPELPMP